MDKVYYLDLQTLLEYLQGQSALLITEVNVPGQQGACTGYLFLKNTSIAACPVQTANRVIVREGESAYQLLKGSAQAYSAIANGDLEARVQVAPESALWQVVAPLNTLLNRAQRWKESADQWDKTLLAIRYVRQELQQARNQHTPPAFPNPTETPVDLLIPEVYALSQQAYRGTRPQSDHF